MGQVRKIQLSVEYLEQKLEEFERRYQMDSESFYQRFNSGDLDDHPEFIEWAAYYDMAAKAGLRRKEKEKV